MLSLFLQIYHESKYLPQEEEEEAEEEKLLCQGDYKETQNSAYVYIAIVRTGRH